MQRRNGLGLGYPDNDAQSTDPFIAAKLGAANTPAWFYASAADRSAQVRTPITDGAAGKPWVFRYKDLRGWWSNPHYNRPGGVESGTPTAWAPEGFQPGPDRAFRKCHAPAAVPQRWGQGKARPDRHRSGGSAGQGGSSYEKGIGPERSSWN